MRPAVILLALTAFAVARPFEATTDSSALADAADDLALIENVDSLVEQAWQDEVVGHDFGDLEDRRRARRLKRLIKRLVRKAVKKALKKEGAPAAPADGAPADGAPADGAPADGAPADGAPADGAPADGTPPADGADAAAPAA